MALSNNPPDVVLELTKDEATMLLTHCDNSLAMGLAALDTLSPSRANAEKMVALMEKYKSIREKLKRQGVKTD